MGTGPAQTPRSTRAGPEPSPAPPGPGDTGDSDVTQEGSGPAGIRGAPPAWAASAREKISKMRTGTQHSPGRSRPTTAPTTGSSRRR
ncbi:ATP8B3 isoform 2 [Pan troglodytes]|uniref:ATP8B3 isoform 2 n=1 Tax=Pan troglodytes TaxID=9598 RepID=A0A2J8J1S2_PANTR|nr:ATP8B3 isoform 2 [Pan troglodytes]